MKANPVLLTARRYECAYGRESPALCHIQSPKKGGCRQERDDRTCMRRRRAEQHEEPKKEQLGRTVRRRILDGGVIMTDRITISAYTASGPPRGAIAKALSTPPGVIRHSSLYASGVFGS